MHNADSAAILVVLGIILSCSILADVIARRTRIPRISLLVMVGVGIAAMEQLGPGLGSETFGAARQPLIQLALVMVAFLLGGEFTAGRLRKTAHSAVVFSLTVVLVSAVVVAAGLSLLGYPLVVTIVLAAIAVATDPAAVVESIDRDAFQRPSARLLLTVVAIDDAWGIIFFGLAMAGLGWLTAGGASGDLLTALWELGGAVLLGVAIGVPAAWLTGRLSPGEPTRVEAFALILLLAGLSSALAVSELLSAMVAGAVIVNLANHHQRSFNEIEQIKWPFLVFFFVLSGASIDLMNLQDAAGLVVAYFLFRLLGRYLGGLAGTRLISRQEKVSSGLGLAMTPQAGVAIGMALLASERFPEQAALVMTVVVTSTVLFEIIGPWLVRRVLS